MRLSFLAATAAVVASATIPAMAAEEQRGEALFGQYCAKCHGFDPAATDKRGPHLKGLFERRYGSVEGFPYRMVWPDADPVWTEAQLHAYLEIHRIPEADERADVIAYLKRAAAK